MIGLVMLNLLGIYVLRRTQRKAQAAAPAVALADLPEAAPQKLAKQMEQVFYAAEAYHRDFDKWPENIETLIGHFLPRGFELSAKLTFRPVPASESNELGWVLVMSEPLQFDLSGGRLHEPRCLALRLSGRIELLDDAEPASSIPSTAMDVP
jgi:hypothetical protein